MRMRIFLVSKRVVKRKDDDMSASNRCKQECKQVQKGVKSDSVMKMRRSLLGLLSRGRAEGRNERESE